VAGGVRGGKPSIICSTAVSSSSLPVCLLSLRSNSHVAITYHNDASTELYSGSLPRSGNRLGNIPCDTCFAQLVRMDRASSNRPVARHSPRSEIKVSRPQSANQG